MIRIFQISDIYYQAMIEFSLQPFVRVPRTLHRLSPIIRDVYRAWTFCASMEPGLDLSFMWTSVMNINIKRGCCTNQTFNTNGRYDISRLCDYFCSYLGIHKPDCRYESP